MPLIETKNIPLLRYQDISHLDRNPKLLYRFHKLMRKFNNFRNLENPNDPINFCIFNNVLSKLRYRATDLISSHSNLNTWQTVKEGLELL